jgi:hypothetical protein
MNTELTMRRKGDGMFPANHLSASSGAMIRRPANNEMVEGYMDGFDLNNPEPSSNRSHSYRHGFANGRADKRQTSRGYTFEELEHMADEAMDKDNQALSYSGA